MMLIEADQRRRQFLPIRIVFAHYDNREAFIFLAGVKLGKKHIDLATQTHTASMRYK